VVNSTEDYESERVWKSCEAVSNTTRRTIDAQAVLFSLLGLLLGKANGQVKPSSKEESAAIAAKCKAKLIYQPKLQLPEDWLGKDEKYVREPVIAFTIREDGTVRDVKLIHRTGGKSSMPTS